MDLKLIAKKNNWKIKKLDKVTFFQEGPGVRNHQYTKNGVKLLNVANLFDGQLDLSRSDRFISEDEAYGKYSHFLTDEGDLIIACSGIQVDYFHKKMGFVKKEHLPLCMNTSTMRFKVLDDNILDLNYLAYYLKTDFFKNQIQRLITGSAQLNFGPSHIKKIDILIPSLETQKKIVKVLDKAQRLIDARKEQLRLMDELIQSVFYEMFGDPVTNPKGWEQMKLKKSCNVITGNTPSRNELDNYGDYIEWIKSDNINTPYTFLTRAEEYLSEKGLEKGKFTEANSILMTCIAGSLSCIGNVAIADRRVAFNQQINAIVPLKYEKMFLYVMFLLTKSYIQNASSNSMKGMISKGKLEELQFIVPDRMLQEAFEEKVNKIEEQKKFLKQSLNELELNYYSLVKNAFNGELL